MSVELNELEIIPEVLLNFKSQNEKFEFKHTQEALDAGLPPNTKEELGLSCGKIFDQKGNLLYYEDFRGFWLHSRYNEKGVKVYYKESAAYEGSYLGGHLSFDREPSHPVSMLLHHEDKNGARHKWEHSPYGDNETYTIEYESRKMMEIISPWRDSIYHINNWWYIGKDNVRVVFDGYNKKYYIDGLEARFKKNN